VTLPDLDFDHYHRHVLPERCVTTLGRAAADDVAGIPPIAFRVAAGRAYRFAARDGVIEIVPGADAPIVVELDPLAWADFVREMASAAGLLYAERARLAGGAAADLERWEPALRALYQARPFFDPAAAVFRDAAGAPLAVRRRFSLSDPAADLRHFLAETGFLHVGGVLSADEIARLRALVEAQAARAVPDDGTSWWAVRRDGARVLCRLIYLGMRVPEIAALSDDPRLLGLAALGPEPVRAACDRADGHSVVVKNADVVTGLSDLPWHRDCGLGGHPVTCPTLNLGIQLDAATAASGRLQFLAGSHRGSVHRSLLARPDLPIVAVDTEPGDVTVHLGDVLHAAPPPEGPGPGRRVLYLTFMPPRAFDVIRAGTSYNDVIRLGVGRAR
jgi:hypothetical protein